MHAHTHARRQAQTHLKALAAASRPPANPDRRQQHASRTGRYSKCGRHWAGPARGGAGYALQPIVTSVGASSVSYRAIAPRRCRQSQCSCATGAGSTSASARTWRCARADAPRACQAPTGAWCLTRPSRPESIYAGCHLGLRGPSADWDGYIIVWLCDEQAVLILRHSVAGFQWRGEPTHSPASISDVHKATCMWFFIPVLQLYLLLHTSS